MGGINAAIDVGKHKLDIALGRNGELFSEPNQAPRNCAASPTTREKLGCQTNFALAANQSSVLLSKAMNSPEV